MPNNRSPITNNRVNAQRAFTLLELLIVLGIMISLTVLVVPAFTNRKGADDLTSAAYAIKGVLETARTYAQANNTYTWVGFFEEDGSILSTTPPTGGRGRLVMSVVASKDGTIIYDPNAAGTNNPIDPTRLTQVTKLVKIDNVHLPLLQVGTGTGDTFDARPSPAPDSVNYNTSRFGDNDPRPTPSPAPTPTAPYNTTNGANPKFQFQYPVGNPAPTAQYTFTKTLRFSSTGENRINSTYDARQVFEIGLIQTHGNATPVPTSGAGTSAVVFSGNAVAIQIGGFNGNVNIYRR
jgi:type II secretory pathway pseudopilin PulG